MKRTLTVASITSALAAAQLVGCDARGAPSDPPSTPSAAALIGGSFAGSAALDAVGALAVVHTQRDCATGEPVTETVGVCTATLIAPRVAVTAKHCIELVLKKLASGMEIALTIGADRDAPRRRVRVRDWLIAEPLSGGWVDNGHDVAVLLLSEAVRDVAPIAVAAPREELVGKSLAAVGFGLQSGDPAQRDAGQSGTRMAGSVHLNALAGKTYASIFDGDFDAFRAWYLEEFPAPAPGEVDDRPSERALRDLYEGSELLPGYEAHAGARPGDAQPCHGDSGGPLIDVVDGKLVSYGVASGGLRSLRSICDGGSVYAVFGPDTLSLFERARTWRGVCGEPEGSGWCSDDDHFTAPPPEVDRTCVQADATSAGT